jgi:hypothetical protein
MFYICQFCIAFFNKLKNTANLFKGLFIEKTAFFENFEEKSA